jgi:hypothetical protein
MMARWAFGGVLLGCLACSGKSERDHHTPALPLVPGTCVNTDCSWPTVEVHEPAPFVSCAITDGPPVEVVWSQKATKVPCESAECFVVPSDVAVGASGEMWTRSRLIENPLAYEVEPMGFELRRSTTSGALELERVTHTGSSLTNASGMSVTANGELDWVGPSPDGAGLSLLHYDRAGNATSAAWLIEHATSSETHFGPHGITVVYRYVTAVEGSDGDEGLDESMGVARFDAQGSKLQWNQAFSHVGAPLSSIALVGVGHAGGVKVVLATKTSWEGYGAAFLVQLHPDGGVAWARDLEASPAAAVVGFNPADESVLMAGWPREEDGLFTNVVVESIDSHGDSEWQAGFEAQYAMSVTMSSAGEAWIYASLPVMNFLEPPQNAFFSTDGTTCVRHSLDLELGLPTVGQPWLDTLVFHPLPNEKVAFAASGRYGVLALP